MIEMISTLWYLVGPVIDNFNLNILAWSQEYEIRVCQLPNAHPKLSNKRAQLKIKIFLMYIFLILSCARLFESLGSPHLNLMNRVRR